MNDITQQIRFYAENDDNPIRGYQTNGNPRYQTIIKACELAKEISYLENNIVIVKDWYGRTHVTYKNGNEVV